MSLCCTYRLPSPDLRLCGSSISNNTSSISGITTTRVFPEGLDQPPCVEECSCQAGSPLINYCPQTVVTLPLLTSVELSFEFSAVTIPPNPEVQVIIDYRKHPNISPSFSRSHKMLQFTFSTRAWPTKRRAPYIRDACREHAI